MDDKKPLIAKYINRAVARVKKHLDSPEKVNEISNETKQNYIDAAYKNRQKNLNNSNNKTIEKKRRMGIQRASRLMNNESLDEVSDNFVGTPEVVKKFAAMTPGQVGYKEKKQEEEKMDKKLNEGKMKELASDLENMNPGSFKVKWKKDKQYFSKLKEALDESWSKGASYSNYDDASKAKEYKKKADSYERVAKGLDKTHPRHIELMSKYHSAMAKYVKHSYHAGKYGSKEDAKKDHDEYMNLSKKYKNSSDLQEEALDESSGKLLHAGVAMSKGTWGSEKHVHVKWSFPHDGGTHPDGMGVNRMHPRAVARIIETHPKVKELRAKGYRMAEKTGMVSSRKKDILDHLEAHKARKMKLYGQYDLHEESFEQIDEGFGFRKPRDPWSPDVPLPKKDHIKKHYPKNLWTQHDIKEETQINELSYEKVDQYFTKAAMNRCAADKAEDDKTVQKRDRGLRMAVHKQPKVENDWDDEAPTKSKVNKFSIRNARRSKFAQRHEETETPEVELSEAELTHIANTISEEEFKQLDELSRKTLGSYIKKATVDYGLDKASSMPAVSKNQKASEHYNKRANKRFSGITKATNKLTKEGTMNINHKVDEGQLDELSKTKLGQYVKKANDDNNKTSYGWAQDKKTSTRVAAAMKIMKRNTGITKAVDKLVKEDFEKKYPLVEATAHERVPTLKAIQPKKIKESFSKEAEEATIENSFKTTSKGRAIGDLVSHQLHGEGTVVHVKDKGHGIQEIIVRKDLLPEHIQAPEEKDETSQLQTEDLVNEDLTIDEQSLTIKVRENGKEKKVDHTKYHQDMAKVMAGHMDIATFKKRNK